MKLKTEDFSLAVTITLSLLIVLLFLYLLRPFFAVILWASVLAFFFYPFYKKLTFFFKGWRVLSAIVIIFIFIAFVIIPLFLLTLEIVYQAEYLISQIDESLFNELYSRLGNLKSHALWGKVWTKLGPYLENLKDKLSEYLSHLLALTFNLFQSFLKATFTITFKIVLTIFTLFYFLLDGERIVITIKKLLPGSTKNKEEILARIGLILRAVFFGSLLTALVQGFLATILYLIFGVPAYLLWGVLTGVASFIPFPGTALIWFPLGLYLIFGVSLGQGILLLVTCALTVAQIDNILKPFFISGKAKLHNLLVFFSVLGGIISFGILGLFLGPLILGLFLSVVEAYQAFLSNSNPEKLEEERGISPEA